MVMIEMLLMLVDMLSRYIEVVKKGRIIVIEGSKMKEQTFIKIKNENDSINCANNRLPSDGVDRDSGGESGHGASARRDRETKCLSRLEPGVPIHLHSPDPPRLTSAF